VKGASRGLEGGLRRASRGLQGGLRRPFEGYLRRWWLGSSPMIFVVKFDMLE